jgi:hypothetical protein
MHLRRSLERFFTTGLAGVRVWTGAALPRSIGAEAVTWNDQIWLADPAPDFSSHATVRLLAHELAHVCQQRAAPGRPACPIGIGEPDDCLETEAEACADAFLAGLTRPALTPDPSPLLRRVLTIVPDTAKLTFDFGGQKPTADFGIDTETGVLVMVGHLPKNFTDVNNFGEALFWSGEAAVRSAVSDPAELKTLRFGFIQFCRFDAWNFTWVGRSPSEGEIDINPFGALTATVSLDSNADATPFTNTIELPVSRGIARASHGDHPAVKAPVQKVNRSNQANNFLFEVINRRRFWTILSAQERSTGRLQHLASHSWDLVYRFNLSWRGGSPVISLNQSDLSPVDPVTTGPPTESALSSLLESPGPPFHNVLGRAARNAAVTGGLPTREDLLTRRAVNVPADFFL